jgi:hypothetical protein
MTMSIHRMKGSLCRQGGSGGQKCLAVKTDPLFNPVTGRFGARPDHSPQDSFRVLPLNAKCLSNSQVESLNWNSRGW